MILPFFVHPELPDNSFLALKTRPEQRQEVRVNEPSHFLEIDGVTIHFKCDVKSIKNLQEGSPKVFIHGLSGNTEVWFNQSERFKGQGVYIDLPGCGESSNPTDSSKYTVPFASKVVASVLDALDLKKVDVIGFSYGGSVGIDFAARYPSYPRSLTIIDQPILPPPSDPEVVKQAAGPMMIPDKEAFGAFIPQVAHMLIGSRMLDAQPFAAKNIFDGMVRNEQFVTQNAFTEAMMQSVNHSWVGNNIRCPMLLIRGKESPFYGSTPPFGLGDGYNGNVKTLYGDKIWIVEIPFAGHFVHVDQGDATNRIVSIFTKAQ